MKILNKKQRRELDGLSDSTVRRKEEAGEYPQRIQLGPNRVGWIEDEVLEWLRSRPRGPLPTPDSIEKQQAETAKHETPTAATAAGANSRHGRLITETTNNDYITEPN